MQDELVRGSAPAAAPGAITRDVRLCLACLHENRGGEQSCEVCGTSLYLILCGACEAVNDPGALRCYGCGAALGPELGDKPAAAVASGPMSLVRAGASAWRAGVAPARRMNRGRLALVLAAVVVTTAGFAYFYFPRTTDADRAPQSARVEATPVKAESEVMHVKPEITPVKPVEPPARVTPPRTEPRARVPAAAPSASVGAAPEFRPAHARVTHTRPADASQTAPSPVVVRAAPQAAPKSESGCSEAVVALGLCNTSAKSGVQ